MVLWGNLRKIMTNEIIELLPSVELKAKIKETNYQFNENELLQIIYRYAPSFDKRIDLLERFSNVAKSDVSALANVYIKYEKEKFLRFIEAPDGFVYELLIKDTPEAYEEKYLCLSYQSALVCIDRFHERYADVDLKETEKSRYRIIKRKVFWRTIRLKKIPMLSAFLEKIRLFWKCQIIKILLIATTKLCVRSVKRFALADVMIYIFRASYATMI